MKPLTLAALPLTLILGPAASPASAAPQDIVVTAPSTRAAALAGWSQRVQRDLERKMAPPRMLSAAFAEGLVAVEFVCSETGRPGRVTLLQSSGRNALDQAALRAVRRLSSLHPMVEGMRPNQRVVAQMLYLNSYTPRRVVQQRLEALEAKARADNSWFTREQIASGEVLLLGAVH